jgi:hypothetical protein
MRLPSEAHPNIKLKANCSSELQTMNYMKGHLFARDRVQYRFRALADRTIRERRREERRLAEQRGMKHQFRAKLSYRSTAIPVHHGSILTGSTPGVSWVLPQRGSDHFPVSDSL